MKRPLALGLFASLLAGCTGAGGSGAPASQPIPAIDADRAAPDSIIFSPGTKIKHVVVLIQENRTVDNLFNGFPGADTVRSGKIHTGATVALQPMPFEEPWDPDHEHSAWVTDYDRGKMDGFDLPPTTPSAAPPHFAYSYVPQAETIPYWTLARNFTFADRNFAAETGPSYPGHQYLIAGQSDYAIGNPDDALLRWSCDAAAGTDTPTLLSNGSVTEDGPFPCYNYATIGDALDDKHVSWRYYTELEEKQFGAGVQPYGAIHHIRYGKDWANIVAPQTQLFTDIAQGKLAGVTYVNPPLIASDHAQQGTNLGPDWIGDIVNAIGTSQYWKDTAILVTWDDWGGWYDHVPPRQLDRMGLSFRVPLIVISPYARKAYVSHVQHEPGSILHFIEEVFQTPSLHTTDVRADALQDCFDFAQVPLPYVKVTTKVPPTYFATLPADTKPIDY